MYSDMYSFLTEYYSSIVLKDWMATGEGGSEQEPLKILLKEPGLYPRQFPVTHKRWIEAHTNRQDNKVMDQPQVFGMIP
jgi:hypothetical protein